MIFLLVRAASPIYARSFDAPLGNAHYKRDVPARCVLPIIKEIAYYLAHTTRKWKYTYYSKTACSKRKRMLIALVLDHYSTISILLDPLVSHCTLPLNIGLPLSPYFEGMKLLYL
jgi:hypothetical protein